MRNFAFGKARDAFRRRRRAAGLVAEAMLAPDGGERSGDVRVVKAGGIDLIDLMKEGLLAPSEVTSLSLDPGPRRHRADAGRRPQHRSDGHARCVWLLTRPSATAIRRLRMRLANRRARRSAPSRRWEATSCSVRAAGISARPSSAACARAAATATRFPAKTNITRSSTTGSAPSSILRRRPRRSSRSARRSHSRTRTAERGAWRSRTSSSAGSRRAARERSEGERAPHCRFCCRPRRAFG